MSQNHYAVLGISETASPEEIKKAFRMLARKYHPDSGSPHANEEKFKEIQNAYDALRGRNQKKSGRHTGGAGQQSTSSKRDPTDKSDWTEEQWQQYRAFGGTGRPNSAPPKARPPKSPPKPPPSKPRAQPQAQAQPPPPRPQTQPQAPAPQYNVGYEWDGFGTRLLTAPFLGLAIWLALNIIFYFGILFVTLVTSITLDGIEAKAGDTILLINAFIGGGIGLLYAVVPVFTGRPRQLSRTVPKAGPGLGSIVVGAGIIIAIILLIIGLILLIQYIAAHSMVIWIIFGIAVVLGWIFILGPTI